MREPRVSMTRRHLLEWVILLPPLDQIVAEYLAEVQHLGGPSQWICTSLYRTPAEDSAVGGSGIHSVNRAADLTSTPWDQTIADAAAAAVNSRWLYDPSRDDLRCVLSAVHGTGAHVHFQVHPRTRRRWRL